MAKKSDNELGRYKEIGLKIGYYRRRKGLTQGTLAEIVGISANYMGSIERGNGEKSYSMDIMLKIAEALDVSVGDLTDKKDIGT